MLISAFSNFIPLPEYHRMIPTLTVFVLLSIAFVQAIPVKNELCQAQVFDNPGSCQSTIRMPQSCNSSTLNLEGTQFASCTDVRLSWNYPVNNLTIIMKTPFTLRNQPYAVHIDTYYMGGIRLYRIRDGKETEVKSTDNAIVQLSDSNHEVILKLQAASTLSLYVLFFNYKVTKIF